MSKQTRFTEIENGKMYLSEEVDAYIEMLSGAYTEISEEVDTLQAQRAKVDTTKVDELEKAKATLEEQLKRCSEEKTAYEAQLKKQAEELRAERQARKMAEENLSKLKELLNEKESDNSLKIELEDERENNIRLQKQLDSERRRVNKLQADKKQLEEENFKKTDEGKAEAYISLLERTNEMADTYVQDIESKMGQLHEEAKASAQEALSSANEQSAKVLEEANSKAEAMIAQAEEKSGTMISEASKKRNEVMARAKAEYDGIRKLIEKASKEYAGMVEDASKDEVDWN